MVLIYAAGEIGLTSWNVSTFLPMTHFYAWASPSQTAAALFTLPAAGVIIDLYRGSVGGSGSSCCWGSRCSSPWH